VSLSGIGASSTRAGVLISHQVLFNTWGSNDAHDDMRLTDRKMGPTRR
jgi:hypothetical protein